MRFHPVHLLTKRWNRPMSADPQRDILVGIANATPGAVATAAAQSHAINPTGILTWLTISLVVLQIAYYAWKWIGDYKARRRIEAREAREEAHAEELRLARLRLVEPANAASSKEVA